MSKGMLIVVSGPSGVGKGTVLEQVFAKDSNLAYSVSCTTREKRSNDIDGVTYHFISRDTFEKNIAEDKMLEYTVYCDNYYGTSAEFVEIQRNQGKDVVLEIETDGAMQIMKKYDDAVTIFIGPPSFQVLENRLRNRATDSEEVIEKRLSEARLELTRAHLYQYTVINNALEDAVEDVYSILRSERIKIKNKNYNFEV